MYQANENRYEKMRYNRCGRSGLMLPAVSLGLWHNFGDNGSFANMVEMCTTAFDNGITHFDLANNYGPTEGSAEVNLGKIIKEGILSDIDSIHRQTIDRAVEKKQKREAEWKNECTCNT